MLICKAATFAITTLRLCRFLGTSVCSLTGCTKPSSGLSGVYVHTLCKQILQMVCLSYKRKEKKKENILGFVGNLRSFPGFHRYEKKDLSKSVFYHLQW